MAFENASHIDELVASSPLSTDDPFGANAIYLELQQLKTVLQTDFPQINAAVTCTPAELNYNDIATLGTAEASKTLTADATANVNATALTWTNLGTVTTADINGGTWYGTIDGSWTATTQTCADLGTVTTADINGGTWQGTVDGAWTAAGQTCADLGAVTTADINGGTWQGTIDGAWTAVGQTCADLGAVTTADINGGTADSVTVGGTTPAAGSFTTLDATTSLGYATGAGGTVTQATSRTTGVTLNKTTGAITLVSAAGSTSWQTFTVTNSLVAATDTILVNQKSGTDLNLIHVTTVATGSFNITFATTGGTTTEQPVFNFAVVKGVTS